MLSQWLKCRKKTESKNPWHVKTKSGSTMVLPNFTVCGSKKSRYSRQLSKYLKVNFTGFTYSACRPLPKNKERIQNLKKQEAQYANIKTSYMEWLMDILQVYSEKQILIKYYVINHLILLKIQNMMDIKESLVSIVHTFLIKRLLYKKYNQKLHHVEYSFSIIVFNMMKLLVILFMMKVITQIKIFKKKLLMQKRSSN